MGLAASQCRLLSLTSRLSDLELRAQTLSNQKVALASATSAASSKYINALNNQYVNMWDPNGTYTQATADMLTCYNAATGADQLFLQNDLGQVLCKDSVLGAFKDSFDYSTGIYDLNAFLDDPRIDCSTGVKAQSILAQAASMNADFNSILSLVNTMSTQNSILEAGGLQDAYTELQHYVGIGTDENGNQYVSQIEWAKTADNDGYGNYYNGDNIGGFSSRVSALSDVLTGKTAKNQAATSLLENTLEMTTLKDIKVDISTGKVQESYDSTSASTIDANKHIFFNEHYYDYDTLLTQIGATDGLKVGSSALDVVGIPVTSRADITTSYNDANKSMDNSSEFGKVMIALEEKIREQFVGRTVEGETITTNSNYMTPEEYSQKIKPLIDLAKYAVYTNIIKNSQKAVLPVVDGEAGIGMQDGQLANDTKSDLVLYNSAIPWSDNIVNYYNNSTNKSGGICNDTMYAISDTFRVSSESVANEFLAYFNALMAGNVDLSKYYDENGKLTNNAFTTMNSNYITEYDDNAINFTGENHNIANIEKLSGWGAFCSIGLKALTAVVVLSNPTLAGVLGTASPYLFGTFMGGEIFHDVMNATHVPNDVGSNYYPTYTVDGINQDGWYNGHDFLYGNIYHTWTYTDWKKTKEEHSYYGTTYQINSNIDLYKLTITDLLNDEIMAALQTAVRTKSDNPENANESVFNSVQSAITGNDAYSDSDLPQNLTNLKVYDARAKFGEIDLNKKYYIVLPSGFDFNGKTYIDASDHVYYMTGENQTKVNCDVIVGKQPVHHEGYWERIGTIEHGKWHDPWTDMGTFYYGTQVDGKTYYICDENGNKIGRSSPVTNGSNLDPTSFVNTNSNYYLVADDGTKYTDSVVRYGKVKDFCIASNFMAASYQRDENGQIVNQSEPALINGVKMFYTDKYGRAYTVADTGSSETDIQNFINNNFDNLYIKTVLPRTSGSLAEDLQKNGAESLESLHFEAAVDVDGSPIWKATEPASDFYAHLVNTTESTTSGYNPYNFFSKEISLNNYKTISSKDDSDYADYKTKYLKEFQDSIKDWVESLRTNVNETLDTFDNLRNGYFEYERNADGSIKLDENGYPIKKLDELGNEIYHKGTLQLLKEALQGDPDNPTSNPGIINMMQKYITEYCKENDLPQDIINSIMTAMNEFKEKYTADTMQFTTEDLKNFEEDLQKIFAKLNKSATYIEGKEPDENKIEYFTNIFNAIKRYGAKAVGEDKWNNKEWLNEQLLVGNIHTSVCTSGYLEQKPYNSFDYISIDTLNDELISKAQAEYEAEVNRISKKEKKIDRELSMIETEHTALENKVEEIKTVKDKNIERGFNLFS